MCQPQHLNYYKFEKDTMDYLKKFLTLYTDKDGLKEIYKEYKNNKDR